MKLFTPQEAVEASYVGSKKIADANGTDTFNIETEGDSWFVPTNWEAMSDNDTLTNAGGQANCEIKRTLTQPRNVAIDEDYVPQRLFSSIQQSSLQNPIVVAYPPNSVINVSVKDKSGAANKTVTVIVRGFKFFGPAGQLPAALRS